MRSDRWGLFGLGLAVVACWMLLQPYRGITHDGTLYGLLALSHLHPGSLDHDLFVRLGVQYDYTVFTPIYAGAVELLGFEHAAALLTLLAHLAFYSCAWLLARHFGSARTAWLGVGLLLVLPTFYGWGNVFAYTESFLTPRQPAEAFGLAGLIAALRGRQLLAAGFMLGALLLHPIIAAAAIALWGTLFLGLPRWREALAVVVPAAVLVILLSAFFAKGPFAHFDIHWLTILKDRLKYLFPTRWPINDWGPTVVPLAVLFIGAFATQRPALRELCLAAALTVACGVLFAVVESDWLHVIIAGQVQLWRWLWLSSVLAGLLLPVIALDCWRAGGLQRAALFLALAAWIDTSGLFAVLAACAACSVVLAARHLDNPRITQFALIAGFLMLAFALATVLVAIHRSLPALSTLRTRPLYGQLLQFAHLLAAHGVLPALLLVLGCALLERGPRGALLVTVLGIAACAAVAPQALQRWQQMAYTPQRLAAFSLWRRIIPPGASILWPEDPPMDAWFVLERPSYWSLYQMAGMVFSRDDAMIGTWLESQTNPVLADIRTDADNGPEDWKSPHALEAICRLPNIGFFASWNNLGPSHYPPVAPDGVRSPKRLYLYRCAPGTSPRGPDAAGPS